MNGFSTPDAHPQEEIAHSGSGDGNGTALHYVTATQARIGEGAGEEMANGRRGNGSAGSHPVVSRLRVAPNPRFRLQSLDELFRSIGTAVQRRQPILTAGERKMLESAIGVSVIPELLNRIDDTRSIAPAAGDDEKPPVDIDRMLACLLDRDPKAYHHLMDEFERLECSAATFLEGPVRDLAERIGELWTMEAAGFFEVTLAVARLQTFVWELIRRPSPELDRTGQGNRILLARMKGEEHTLGLLVVAACFQENGWEIVGGVDLETGPHVLDAVSHERFDAFGISISASCNIPALKGFVAEVRDAASNPAMAICLGGPDAMLRIAAYRTVGADIIATDALSAVRAVERFRAQAAMS